MGKGWGTILAAAAVVVAGCAPSPDLRPQPTPSDTVPATTAPSATDSPSAPAEPEPVVPAPPLEAAELATYGGVATLVVSAGCTGTLIDTGVDSAPAYLLTNGHCVGVDGMSANDTLIDSEGQGEVRFFNVAGGADKVLSVPVTRFEYGTMRGVDVGIIRVDATLGELRAAGAVPLKIASEAPAEGTKVVNIASPTQGVAADQQVLRKGECTLGATVDLIEHKWLWLDAPRTDCPGVLGGSSGSPMIADGEIVSIINTTNTGVPADRGASCYLGKPCEITDNGAEFVPNSSYGVDIAGMGACFPDGTFALGDDCPLAAGSLSRVGGGGIYGADGTDGGDRPAELTLEAGGAQAVAVVQGVPLKDARTCTDPATYDSAPMMTLEDGVEVASTPVTLPTINGFVLACAAEPGNEEAAARFVYSVDTVAPTEGPKLSQTPLGEDELMIDPLFDIPDIADIHLVFGPVDETDCSDRSSYFPYRRQPLFFAPEDLPARFCAVGFDMAGNESPVTDQIVER